MSTKITPEETSAELTLSEALKQAKEWQESAELALPAEIMTALIDGVDELRQALVDVRVLLLPDSRHDMRPSMQSITLAKERIRAALSLIEAPKETQSMNCERQGLERWAAVDLSDVRNSLRRQPDRMTWQRVWLYLLKIDDEESAQLVRDQNPTLSYECEGDAHDDCHYPHCECVHHRAVVLKTEHAPLKSCRDVMIEQEESEAAA